MIICLYVFLFGIMQSVDSISVSIGAETEQNRQSSRAQAPAVTSAVDEEGRAVYTYATDLNVLSPRKPELADYSRTETMLLIPEETGETEAETTTAVPPDFVMQGDDLDYTVPKTTTTAATTSAETTTTTVATSAETTTTTTVTAAETTTTPKETEDVPLITEPPEDDTDISDLSDNQDVTVVSSESVSSEDTTSASSEETQTTTTSETTAPETTDSEPDNTDGNENSDNNEIFTVNAGGTIVTDTAVNVVAMAVMGEIRDIFDDEAIKAQAIACYTYVKYYNMNGQNAYIAKVKPSTKVINLVKQVIGKALYYDGTMIQAVYCASTAGRTASSKNVWGVDYPYLQSIDTSFIDKEYDINYGRKVTFTSAEIKKFVLDNTGIELSGDPSQWITIDSYFDDIYVGYMTIGGQKSYTSNGKKINITGRAFREKILEYNIRSHCFTIEYDAASDTFTITTYGYGHCVGLSQHGANILASKYGYTYDQILKFYYQGVEIR